MAFDPKPSGIFTVDDRLLASFPSRNAANRALPQFQVQDPQVFSAVLCNKHLTEPASHCGLCRCDDHDEQERYEVLRDEETVQ